MITSGSVMDKGETFSPEVSPGSDGVITSYSIHYTKLYDMTSQEAAGYMEIRGHGGSFILMRKGSSTCMM